MNETVVGSLGLTTSHAALVTYHISHIIYHNYLGLYFYFSLFEHPVFLL